VDARHVLQTFQALGVTLRLGAGGAIVYEPDRGIPEELKDRARAVRAQLAALLANGNGAGDDALRLTDAGNAQRFAEQHGQDLRYCYARRSWLYWSGTHWATDEGPVVPGRAKATACRLYHEAAEAPTEPLRKALAKWAQYSESEPGIRRMLVLAQSEPGIPIRADELDRDPYLLNTPTGTVDLRTGQMRPHRREDLLSKITAAPYQPGARHPLFDAFLERVLPDPEVRAFIQRVVGYAITGSTAEEKLFVTHGPTAGGKSTFLTGLRRTLGDYATSADASTFMDRRMEAGAPRDDLIKLIGRRLVVSSEVKDGVRFATSLVKTLFGGDPMSGRGLYEKTVEFTPVFKLLIAANERPKAPDDDDALWRRLYEIPFVVSIPEAERDPAVKITLCDPAQAGAAILAWAVEGAAEWFRQGLAIPPAVRQATAAYRKAMDPLQDFLTEHCVFEAARGVTAKELRAKYEEWVRENGIRFPIGGRAFSDRLRARGCDTVKRGASGDRWWLGIRLRGPLDLETGATGGTGVNLRDSPYTRAHEESSAQGARGARGARHLEPCDCRECCPRDEL
jgi:putative DNA primase/helicase